MGGNSKVFHARVLYVLEYTQQCDTRMKDEPVIYMCAWCMQTREKIEAQSLDAIGCALADIADHQQKRRL